MWRNDTWNESPHGISSLGKVEQITRSYENSSECASVERCPAGFSWSLAVKCSFARIETMQSRCILSYSFNGRNDFSGVFFFVFCLYLHNFWHSAVGFVTRLCSTRGTERHHTKVLMMSWWSLLRLPVSGVAESILLCLSHCRMLINCEVEQPPNTHPVLFCLMGAPRFFFFFFFSDVQRSRS